MCVIEVGRVGRRAKTYRKLSLLGIFSRLGSFPQVLGQTKRCPMLELYEILKLPHVVAFTFFFIFYCDRVRHAGLLKLMKNDPFLSIFSRCGLFPQDFDRSYSYR